jgi:hypothetical protein
MTFALIASLIVALGIVALFLFDDWIDRTPKP